MINFENEIEKLFAETKWNELKKNIQNIKARYADDELYAAVKYSSDIFLLDECLINEILSSDASDEGFQRLQNFNNCVIIPRLKKTRGKTLKYKVEYYQNKIKLLQNSLNKMNTIDEYLLFCTKNPRLVA